MTVFVIDGQQTQTDFDQHMSPNPAIDGNDDDNYYGTFNDPPNSDETNDFQTCLLGLVFVIKVSLFLIFIGSPINNMITAYIYNKSTCEPVSVFIIINCIISITALTIQTDHRYDDSYISLFIHITMALSIILVGIGFLSYWILCH